MVATPPSVLLTGELGRALAEAEAGAADLARILGFLAVDDLASAEAAATATLADPKSRDPALANALATLAWVAWSQCRARTALGLARAAVRRVSHLRHSAWQPRIVLSAMLIAVGEFDEA